SARVALGVAVLETAVEEIGHGLEPAMRVIGGPLRLAGGEIDRSHLIEKEKRIEVGERPRRERPVHQEPLPFERLHAVDDGGDPSAASRDLGHTHLLSEDLPNSPALDVAAKK